MPRSCGFLFSREKRVTNRELLYAESGTLSESDHQRQHLLRVELMKAACPACLTPTDAITAAGIGIGDYPFDEVVRHEYRCPACHAELEQVVPVVSVGPPWHWQIRHTWLIGRLEKARLHDQMKEAAGGA